MQSELAVALEKGVGGRGSLGHISACLMESYFFPLEHINTELSQSRLTHLPPPASIAVTFPGTRNQ